jgi:hypothetical protein
MPTRKQRRRELKAKRHEYEFVYVDAEGNELEEAPPELREEEEKKRERSAPAKASANGAAKGKGGGSRARREPQPPSWNRAVKRAAMLGIVVFFLFSVSAGKSGNRYVAALVPAVIYTALFIPFTFWIDRFAYRRFQARQAADGGNAKSATRRPAKKR